MDRSDQALSKVREFIERRHFAADGRIPPERTLATELRVGRRSLRRALEVLEQEGRIHRHQSQAQARRQLVQRDRIARVAGIVVERGRQRRARIAGGAFRQHDQRHHIVG